MNYPINMSKQANIDVANFINRAPLSYRSSKIIFFKKLKNFLEILSFMPHLGKVISNYDFEVRQIMYKQYRIFYTKRTKQIYILRIVHSKTNLKDNLF